MELYYGAYKSQKVESNLAKIKTLENSIEIIPLGKEVVEILDKHGMWAEWINAEMASINLDWQIN